LRLPVCPKLKAGGTGTPPPRQASLTGRYAHDRENRYLAADHPRRPQWPKAYPTPAPRYPPACADRPARSDRTAAWPRKALRDRGNPRDGRGRDAASRRPTARAGAARRAALGQSCRPSMTGSHAP